MRFLLIMATVLTLSSCEWFTRASLPHTWMSDFQVPEDGTPIFKQGYRDGCSFLFYARGNGYYRFMHKYKYDPRLSGSNEYRLGYKRGISYCFNFIVPGVYSIDKYLFRYDVSIKAGDYNETGFFGKQKGGLDAFIPQGGGGGLNSVFGAVQKGSGGGTALGGNPLWAGGSKGQLFGQ